MRNILFVLIALVAAVGAGWIIRSQLQSEPEPGQPGEVKEVPAEPERREPATAEILVADDPIQVGDILAESDIGTLEWPVDSVAQGFFRASETSPADLAGRAARRRFAAGQPLAKTGLVDPGDRGFLAVVLDPGMRAISISTTATSGVAGLVYPGDRVDVLLTARKDDGDTVSQALLSNVRIVAVGQQLAPASGDGRSGTREDARGGVVTLEVTPDEARRLAVAKRAGDIQLSLHSFAEGKAPSKDEDDQVTRLGEVMAGSGGETGETTASIRVIEGDSVRSVAIENTQ